MALIRNMWLGFVTQYNSSLSSFVPNFRILSQVVAEKSLTDKKFTNGQTNIAAEKAKNIYPLYTSYREYNKWHNHRNVIDHLRSHEEYDQYMAQSQSIDILPGKSRGKWSGNGTIPDTWQTTWKIQRNIISNPKPILANLRIQEEYDPKMAQSQTYDRLHSKNRTSPDL